MPRKGSRSRKKASREGNEKIPRLMARIVKAMAERKGMVVAFSGGVDSSVLAKLARDALGAKAVAVTADRESLPRSELKDARAVAKSIGIEHLVIKHSELDNELVVRNPENRCYHCRKELTELLWAVAEERGLPSVADGANSDDLKEHRPGIMAADEAGVWHPFIEFEVDKATIRGIAKALGLKVHDKPAAACLLSRIPYGEIITKEKLSSIEKSEEFLKRLGFRTVRVRHHGEMARIEVPVADIGRLLDNKKKVVTRLKKLGFRYVTIDLDGYRSGSMDEAIKRK